MKVRIIVGALLALFLISTLYFGGYYYLTAIALVSFAATYEVAHVITRKGYRPLVFPVYLFALAYPFVYRFFGLTVLVIFYLFSIIVSTAAAYSTVRSMHPSRWARCCCTFIRSRCCCACCWFMRISTAPSA